MAELFKRYLGEWMVIGIPTDSTIVLPVFFVVEDLRAPHYRNIPVAQATNEFINYIIEKEDKFKKLYNLDVSKIEPQDLAVHFTYDAENQIYITVRIDFYPAKYHSYRIIFFLDQTSIRPLEDHVGT